MIAIEKAQSFLNQLLLDDTRTKTQNRIRLYIYITLYLLGIVYWISFIHSDDLSRMAYDWGKEDAYLNTLRLAQTSNTIPWQWSEPFFQDTDKFLANPEVVLTPDIILLRWISNENFIIFHIALFYSTGFLGSLLLAKKLNVSFIAFSFFGLIFNFNGYLTSHIAVGHFQWTGYFLLPFFFIILFRFAEESHTGPPFNMTSILNMALLLGILFLNGSVHIAIWCSMFLIMVLLLQWKMFLNVVTSILIGFMLGFNRLLPASIWFPRKDTLGAGYLSFSSLLDAFTSLYVHNFRGLQGLVGAVGWWEYDIYIGFAAFIILSVSIYLTLKQNKLQCQRYILTAAILFLFLSLGFVYDNINLALPFVSIERLPSRFIVMPFLFFLTISMTGIDELIRSIKKGTLTVILIGFLTVAGELLLHFNYWRVSYLEESFQTATPPIISLIPCLDQTYISIVYVSWAVSLLSFTAVMTLLFRSLLRKTQGASRNTLT